MKATELIKHLADRVAADGDVDVYITTGMAGHYMKAHADLVRPGDVHPKPGTRAQFVHAGKARELGYDTAPTRGVVLG